MAALKEKVEEHVRVDKQTVKDIIKEIKHHINSMPQTDSSGNLPLQIYKGKIETYSLMSDFVSSVDRVELFPGTETLWTKTDKKTLFVAATGRCHLHYVKDSERIIKKLKPGEPISIDGKTPFSLSGDGTTCRLFLIMEGQ